MISETAARPVVDDLEVLLAVLPDRVRALRAAPPSRILQSLSPLGRGVS